MAYNLGTARGQIEITYDSNGTARARADVNNLKSALDEVSRNVAEIRINDAGAQARVDQLLSDLQELNRQRADPSVNLDDAAARTEMERIRTEIQRLDADNANPSVNIDIDQRSLEQLRGVEQQLDALNRLTSDPRVDIDTQLANARIAETRRNMDELSRQRATPSVADPDPNGSIMAKLTKLRLGLIGLAVSLSPAVVPIAASLAGGIGGIAAAAVPAAAGLAILVGSFKALKIASDPAIAGQIKGIQTQFTSMATTIKPQLIDATAAALRGVHNVLGQLQPVFTGAGNAIKAVAGNFELFSHSTAMQSFTAYLGRQAGPAIETFGNAAIKGLTGVMGVLQAFEPLIQPIEQGITSLSQRFATWGQGLASNPGFQSFLNYVRQATPLVIQFGKTVIGLGIDIVRSFAPAGLVILHAINQFGQFLRVIAQSQGFKSLFNGIAALTRGIGNFLEKIGNSTAFKAFINALGGALGKIGQFIGKLLESNTVQQLFQGAMQALTPVLHAVGAVFGFLADHMTTAKIILGLLLFAFMPFTAVVLGIILLIKNFGGVWSAVWGAVKAVFIAIWDAIKWYFQLWWTVITTLIRTELAVIQAIWGAVWGAMKAVFTAIWEAIKWYFQMWWTVVSTIVTTYINVIKTIITTAWTVIQAVTSAVWNAIKAVFSAVWGAIQAVVSAGVNFVRSIISGAWNAIRSITSSVWNAIRSAVTGAINGVRSVVSSVASAVRSAITTAWNAIRSVTSSVWNAIHSAVSGAMNAVRSVVSSASSAVRSAISSAWNGAKSAVSSAIGGIVSLARGIGGRVLGAVGNLGGLLYNAGRSLITGLLNGIKSAVQGVYNFVSGIAGKIKSLKGPLDYDRKVLIDNGAALMVGLHEGIRRQFKDVEKYVSTLAPQLSATFGSAPMASTVGAAAVGASLASRTPSVAVNVPQAQPQRVFSPTFQYAGPLTGEVVNEARRQDDWDEGL